jgi:hypothetical protein
MPSAQEPESFTLISGVRYHIRNCATPPVQWVVDAVIRMSVTATGHGEVPHTLDIKLTQLNYLETGDTYQFHGCVMNSATRQAVTGTYSPSAGNALGTVKHSAY